MQLYYNIHYNNGFFYSFEIFFFIIIILFTTAKRTEYCGFPLVNTRLLKVGRYKRPGTLHK